MSVKTKAVVAEMELKALLASLLQAKELVFLRGIILLGGTAVFAYLFYTYKTKYGSQVAT